MTACAKCGHDPDAAVSARWVLLLDKRLGSVNARTVNSGASRWRYAKERDEWQSWVQVARVNQRITPARGRRRVSIERVYAGRGREMDERNLDVKSLVDALVRESVLRDDAPAYLELHVSQRRGDKNQTVVTVEELAATSDEQQIAKVMATTGIDRAGAERALVDGKRMAKRLIAAGQRKGGGR